MPMKHVQGGGRQDVRLVAWVGQFWADFAEFGVLGGGVTPTGVVVRAGGSKSLVIFGAFHHPG